MKGKNSLQKGFTCYNIMAILFFETSFFYLHNWLSQDSSKKNQIWGSWYSLTPSDWKLCQLATTRSYIIYWKKPTIFINQDICWNNLEPKTCRTFPFVIPNNFFPSNWLSQDSSESNMKIMIDPFKLEICQLPTTRP